MNTMRILLILLVSNLPTTAMALTLSQSPLFIASTEPRVMLVASRDHQLSIKAYTDYTDIDSNGSLDTTYSDNISYYGYFDANKCYNYANSEFEPSTTVAVSTGTHQCNGSTWSGNFMNWASMTRMDVLRKTFYGGYRSTDTGTSTVLERHFLTTDVHAFAKVYNPGSSATLNLYIPSTVVGSNTAISLCNVSDTTSATLTGQMAFPLPAPLIKVAAGTWPVWDASEVNECQIITVIGTQPTATALLGTYNARIKVCDSAAMGGVESNCKTYTNPTSGVQTLKPVGLLQQYGDINVNRRMRFGLMTGSYAANKSGGVLRKNVGYLANNNLLPDNSNGVCSPTTTNATATNINANDEIDVCTGQFINQDDTKAGIINTLNRLHIAGFQYTSGGGNGKHQYGCNNPGILPGILPGPLVLTDGKCVDWGNPLAETYLESLRYFANAGATTAFDVSDATILSSIPKVSWTDPLPSDQWCAISSVLVLSTGLNSFDTDQLTSFTPSGGSAIDASSLTQTVGDASHENINGHDYLIGDNGTTANNQCTAKTISNLATAKGICPEVPSTQGGYGIAGLAYAPKTIDLRPAYAAQRNTRWGGNSASTPSVPPINMDWVLRQPLNTYTVQLGESLPSFNISVGTGTVTMLPACQANSTGTASAWTASSTGWRNCSMTNLVVDSNVAQASVGTDATAKTKTCSGNGTTSRCFSISWEDSTWGNDYDMDGIQHLGYCVGSACDTFKMLCPSTSSANATIGVGVTPGWTSGSTTSSQIRIATCVIQASAGHALTFGYTLAGTGTITDGAAFPILRPGGRDFSIGSVLASGITTPSAITYPQSSSTTAPLLQNPLWYAAKYGSFTESTPTVGTPNPNLTSEWDAVDNLTRLPLTSGSCSPGDCVPDNYFNVRNPSTLITALSHIFDQASTPDASAASVATNSTNLQINGRIFQGKFSSADWSGQLLSYKINASGVISTTAEWDAGAIINSQSLSNTRAILTKGATDGIAFTYSNLTGPTATAGTQMNLLDKNAIGITDNCGVERVAYLRGDASHEGTSGSFSCASPSTSTISKFRPRNTSKLGDIVSSNPWYVGVPAAGYSDVTHPGYSSFLTSKLNRTPMVYVGSNDGMLHGFDASLTINTANPAGIPTSTSGKELLAYIPTAVFPKLSKLTDQNYIANHLYFVDSSPMTADADLSTSTTHDWRTVLVGALGAGGKGYYALDISDPATFSESTSPTNAPANTLLWEFDETDMGYVYNQPPTSSATKQAKQIVKMANGKWAVILGNGYNSVAGKAVLYIVFINDGVDGTWAAGDTVKITADVPAGLDNGLSTPIPVDTNNDGFADTVYAGDLKGNLWKFLVGPNSSDATVTSTTSTWKLAFLTTANAGCPSTAVSCTPLFKPTDSGGLAQPIVSPPEIGAHPLGGQLVFFGTGKYIEASDNTSTSVQTFYGIWDKQDGSTTVGTRAVDLLQQTLSTTACASPAVAGVACTLTTAAGGFRIPTTNAITWRTTSPFCAANGTGTCPSPVTPTHMGWYIDLPSSKERVTGMPQLINKVVFFNTIIPSTAACDAGGTGWLMSLDYLTGGLTGHQVFDTTGNGIIDSSDTKVAGFQVGAALGGTTLIQNQIASSNVGVGVSALTNSNLVSNLINFGTSPFSRLSWRELVQ